MGILSWIILGLVVGVLAKWIMPRKAKPFAIGSITVSGAISCYLLQDVMILQFVTLLILPPALIYLMHLPTSHQHAAI